MTIHNEAYTTPAVNDNLLESFAIRIAPRWRTIHKLGFVGGAALCDGEVELFVGSTKVAVMRNNHPGRS